MVIGVALIDVIGVVSVAATITDRGDGAPRVSARHVPVEAP